MKKPLISVLNPNINMQKDYVYKDELYTPEEVFMYLDTRTLFLSKLKDRFDLHFE